MDIRNKKVLILGGWGLVGSAIARKIVEEKPKQIILTSLKENEAKEICAELSKEFKKPKNYFLPWWGNIFVRNIFKDLPRNKYLDDENKRSILIQDIIDELDDKIYKSSSLYALIKQFKPHVIIDCINTATAIAYQNTYSAYKDIFRQTSDKKNTDYERLKSSVEKSISSSYIPQLIRHVQILNNAMAEFKTKIYVKVGTSGTGGMGLNIPYTHSEEKPSRVLLSKAAVAGAHTLLLFLMARTPDGPIVKEVKPTASIAWKKISYGDIKKQGKSVQVYDIKFNDTVNLNGIFERKLKKDFKPIRNLKTVFIDTGENGIFSAGEFETISTLGQMEFVTPEEIAENVVTEILGGNTGHDVVTALDQSEMGPTYRAGILKQYAVSKIKELEKKNKTNSVAFEMLGPPKLSKLLYEIHLIRLIYKNFNDYISKLNSSRTKKILNLVKQNDALRNEILSLGLPVLLPDGKTLLRGPQVIIPSANEGDLITIDKKKINKWAEEGWVDLRDDNWKKWEKRFKDIMKDAEKHNEEFLSSRHLFNNDYWDNFESINIGKVVGWLFINEEKGLRIKR
ncbi:MAG TPA: polysaccharide biosynthesis protein [Ignavibacteria bacterium]|nr:polysaccharide biosynthesis protein [Ignavibacteria bacterium]